MLVKVAQLFEEGRPLARHRMVTQQPTVVGQLCLIEQHDKELRRAVMNASLRGPVGEDILPPLRDAVVRWIRDGAMTISGLESDTLSRKMCGQSWYVVLIDCQHS